MPMCVDTKELLRYAGLSPEAARADAVAVHLNDCSTCQAKLEAVRAEEQLRKHFQGAIPVVDRPAFESRGTDPTRRIAADAEADADAADAAPTPPPELPTFGRYRATEEVGRGGMGVVYRAEDTTLGRIVALKVVAPDCVGPASRERFIREARAAAQVRSEYLVTVFDIQDVPGSPPVLVMEFIPGETLQDRIRVSGRIAPKAAAEIVRQVALGLAAVHRAGLVHRDVKPSNILLEAGTERARLTDFGLVHFDADVTRLTRTGAIAGTPSYMSPEQARDPSRVDARADIHALGMSLYESITGVVPFRGSLQQVIRQIEEADPVPPRRLDQAIPIDLETICMKCLEKSPARRYPSAVELAEDLRRFLDHEPIRARPASSWSRLQKWRARHPVRAVLAGVAVIAVAGLIGLTFYLQEQNQKLDAANAAAVHEARLSARHLMASEIRRANDQLKEGKLDLALDILAKTGPQQPGGYDPRGFAWRLLNARAQRDLVHYQGGKSQLGGDSQLLDFDLTADGRRMVANGSANSGFFWDRLEDRPRGWSYDGPVQTELALSAGGDRFLVGVAPSLESPIVGTVALWATESARFLARFESPRPGAEASDWRFLQDGSIVIDWGLHDPSSALYQVWKLDAASPRPVLLREIDCRFSFGLTENDQLLAYRDDPAALSLIDLHTGATRITRPIDPCERITPSRDGRLFVTISSLGVLDVRETASGRHLGRYDVGGPVQELRRRNGLPFSPDGATLAVGLAPGRKIVMIDIASGRMTSIEPRDPKSESDADWCFTSNSRYLATGFRPRNANDTNRTPIAVWDVPTQRKIAEAPRDTGDFAFTPDGETLLMSGATTIGAWRFLPHPIQDEFQFPNLRDEAWSAAFSADSGILAVGSDDEQSTTSIRLWDTKTRGLLRSWEANQGTIAALAFSPADGTLAAAGLVREANLRLWDPKSGRLLAMLAGHADSVRSVAFDPSGRTLATGCDDGSVGLWDVRERRLLRRLTGHAKRVNQVAFSPDGRRLVSASDDATARLWDVAAGRLQHEWKADDRIKAAGFSPDGVAVVLACNNGMILFRSPDTGLVLRDAPVHAEAFRSLAVHPKDPIAAVGSDLGDVRLWDTETGQEILVLEGPKARIDGLAFSPDGTMLAATYHDGTVKLWRAP